MNQPPGWGPPGQGPPSPGYGYPPAPQGQGYAPPGAPQGYGPPPGYAPGPPAPYGAPPGPGEYPPGPPLPPGFGPGAWAGGPQKSGGSNKTLIIIGLAAVGLFFVIGIAVVAIVVVASRGKPTAESVCRKLVDEGVARGCHKTVPKGVSYLATEKYDFDLVGNPGRTGTVMSHANLGEYDRTVDMYRAVSVLMGPHRYGSSKKLIFMHLHERTTYSIATRARDVVEGL